VKFPPRARQFGLFAISYAVIHDTTPDSGRPAGKSNAALRGEIRTLYLCEGKAFRRAALHNLPKRFAEMRQRDPVVDAKPGTILGRLARSKRVVHIPDLAADRSYIERTPLPVSAVEIGGFRAALAVPMLKDGKSVGELDLKGLH
jgi:hypothetical protein